MSAIDFLGDSREDFMKSSLDVYCDASGTLQYIGKTEPEKSITFPREIMQFMDGTPRAMFVQDFSQVGVEVQFTFKQVCDSDTLTLALTGDQDKGTYDYVFLGSNPGAIPSYMWRFVGETRDGRLFELVIRKGQIGTIGEFATGSTDYAGLQVTVTALKDESITDDKRDLAYFRIFPKALS